MFLYKTDLIKHPQAAVTLAKREVVIGRVIGIDKVIEVVTSVFSQEISAPLLQRGDLSHFANAY